MQIFASCIVLAIELIIRFWLDNVFIIFSVVIAPQLLLFVLICLHTWTQPR